MPTVKCLRCGAVTNTALCDWIDCEKNKGLKGMDYPKYADRCYAAWDEKTQDWKEGCAYKEADLMTKRLIEHVVHPKEEKHERKSKTVHKVATKGTRSYRVRRRDGNEPA